MVQWLATTMREKISVLEEEKGEEAGSVKDVI